MVSFAKKVCKSVLKCYCTSHSPKMAARTHIAHIIQNAFRTHIAHVRVCAHVCVCEFEFATHSLAKRSFFDYLDQTFVLSIQCTMFSQKTNSNFHEFWIWRIRKITLNLELNNSVQICIFFILCMYFVIMLNYLQVVNIQFFINIGTMYVSKGK